MDSNYTIYIVEDDAATRLLLDNALSKKYVVELFGSGETCLERAEQKLPNLFLLDVGLPGIDGYEVCKMIRETQEWKDIPIIFLSAHDQPEDAWAGYDAGGQDYIVKPFDAGELRRKIEILRQLENEKTILQNQLKFSDELASVVLSSLDEYGILIKFLRTLNECADHQDVVSAILELHQLFHLEPVIQIRMRNLERTCSKNGLNWPLEVAVLNNVRNLDRIFTFKNRAVFNFDHITILITNMPIENAERCGSIRDNIAIVAECAEAKLMALQNVIDKSEMRDELHSLLRALEHIVHDYSKNYDAARVKGSLHTAKLLDELLATLAHVGLSEQQEEQILDMVKARTYELVDLYDIAGEAQATLADLSKKLGNILSSTEKTSLK